MSSTIWSIELHSTKIAFSKITCIILYTMHCASGIVSLYYAESREITERKDVINQLWVDLKDLAEARRQALAGAKEIHTFDRDALDTKERIQVHFIVPRHYSR